MSDTAIVPVSAHRPATLDDVVDRLDALKVEVGRLQSELAALRSELTTHHREEEGLTEGVFNANAIADVLTRRIAELQELMQTVGSQALQRHDRLVETLGAMAATQMNHGRKIDQIIVVLETMAGMKPEALKMAARRAKKPRT